MNRLKRFFKRREAKRSVKRLFTFFQVLKDVYPNFSLEFDLGCDAQTWALEFQVRGEIPWRDRKYFFTSKPEETLDDFLVGCIETLFVRIDILKKRA